MPTGNLINGQNGALPSETASSGRMEEKSGPQRFKLTDTGIYIPVNGSLVINDAEARRVDAMRESQLNAYTYVIVLRRTSDV
jgi:hypothetical protein